MTQEVPNSNGIVGGGVSAHLPNYYEVLNVSPTASRSDIRASYVRLRHTFQSQNQALYSLMEDREVQRQANLVEEAYNILNDELRRRAYDRSIGILGFSETANESSYRQEDLAGSRAVADRQVVPSGSEIPMIDPFNAPSAKPKGVVITPTASSPIRAAASGRDELLIQMKDLISNQEPGDGTLYRKLRELVGVSENEMQDRTKVCIEYIRGIESNVYDRLPRTVFVKGFLRSYFKYLAVPDSEVLVNGFAQKLEEWQKSSPRKA